MKEIQFYNDIYSRQSNASRKRRILFYKELARHILPTDEVLDLGCGNGLLALHSQWRHYTGMDFSDVAIAQARKICPKGHFIPMEINEKTIFNIMNNRVHFDIVVMTEFLEHIENDIEVLKAIARQKRILISVPANEKEKNGLPIGYPTHKRIYNEEVIKRRYNFIKFDNIYNFQNWFIATGIKVL